MSEGQALLLSINFIVGALSYQNDLAVVPAKSNLPDDDLGLNI